MINNSDDLMRQIVDGFRHYDGEPFLIRLDGKFINFHDQIDAEKLRFSGIASIGILFYKYLDLIFGKPEKVESICRNIFFGHHNFVATFKKPPVTVFNGIDKECVEEPVRVIGLKLPEYFPDNEEHAWLEKLHSFSFEFGKNIVLLKLRGNTQNAFLYPLYPFGSVEPHSFAPVFQEGQTVQCSAIQDSAFLGEILETLADGYLSPSHKVYGIGKVTAVESFDEDFQRTTVVFEEINLPLLDRLGLHSLEVTYIDGVMENMPFDGVSLSIAAIPYSPIS